MTTTLTKIAGVPFLALYHHDGRFLRLPGLFAFARWKRDGLYEVLHLEFAEDIARAAGPGHLAGAGRCKREWTLSGSTCSGPRMCCRSRREAPRRTDTRTLASFLARTKTPCRQAPYPSRHKHDAPRLQSRARP